MKKFWILILIFATILGGIFFFLSSGLPQVERGIDNSVIQEITQEVQKKISAPPPLRAIQEEPQSFLTRAGVIKWTNTQREKYNLPPLKESAKLDSSADIKAEDMFKSQYFAHESLSGIGVADLAKDVNYEFIEIGENLALGNFKNDQDLVQAWVDSPGHRANILNSGYQEIGVSVIKGVFSAEGGSASGGEGRETWMAVQHFGLPLSFCPKPDQAVKTEIESSQSQIEELQQSLMILKNKKKIEEYNNLVSQYNYLVEKTRILISQYNNQVQVFNNCVLRQAGLGL